MPDPWPSQMMGIPVTRSPLGAFRSDNNALPRTIAIIHDIEGGAASAIAVFATPGDPIEGGGSSQFVANPLAGQFNQLSSAGGVAYGCGNYEWNRRALQCELPGYAGRPYDVAVLDYAARFLAWCNVAYGVPLVYLTHAALVGGALSGCTGHDQIPDPNNPALSGGKDHHTDPGPTFPWTDVLNKARQYAGNPPGGGGDGGGSGWPDAPGSWPTWGGQLWPTGYRIHGGFRRAFATGNGHWPASQNLDPANSVALFGYPVGREFVDEGQNPHLVVQYFERARFELHADGTVTLGRVGAEQWEQRKHWLPSIASTPEK